MLRIELIVGSPAFTLAAPCEICERNGLLTEGPLCAHCEHCRHHCEEAHEFTPRLSETEA
jgi:hypothetical protein